MTSEKQLLAGKIQCHFHHCATTKQWVVSFQQVSSVSTHTSIVLKRWVIKCNCPCLRSQALWNVGHPLTGCVEEDQCETSTDWIGLKFSWPHTSRSDSAPPVVCTVSVQVWVWKSFFFFCCRVVLYVVAMRVWELNLTSGDPCGNIWIWEEERL